MQAQVIGVGSTLGGYVLERELGQGGMGVVYRVRDAQGTPYAMKVMQRPDGMSAEEADTRLAREANVSRVIRHPGVVQMVGYGTIDVDRRYLVMELLEGLDLDEYIANREPTLAQVFEVLLPAMDALEAAHTLVNLDGTPQPVVHRDVKPSNIYVLHQPKDGSSVRVVDFGLVRQQGAQAVTRASAGFGTMFYMAPEQFSGAGQATPAADVWSLAVMIYEAVTSSRPFLTDDVRSMMGKVIQGHPPRLDTVVRSCPASLAELVDRCLEPDARLRPQTAGALAASLRAILSEPAVVAWTATVRVQDPGDRSVQSLVETASSAPSAATGFATSGGSGARPASSAATPAAATQLASPASPRQATAAPSANALPPAPRPIRDVGLDATMLAAEGQLAPSLAPTAPAGTQAALESPGPTAASSGAAASTNHAKTLGIVVVCAVGGYALVQVLLRFVVAGG